jgi:hypothetical protein
VVGGIEERNPFDGARIAAAVVLDLDMLDSAGQWLPGGA